MGSSLEFLSFSSLKSFVVIYCLSL